MSDVAKTHLILGRVAGYDTAVYGVPTELFPLLFEDADGNLIATTKLSGFVSGRFAPTAEWKHVWRTILRKLDPNHEPPSLDFEPIVRPSDSTDEAETLHRAAAFCLNARLLVAPDRRDEIHRLLRANTDMTDVPTTQSAGDGTLGMLEGYAAAIRPDGSQPQRTPIRADCCAETAMVLSLDSSNARARTVATNLLTYTFGPEMQSLGRLDPRHPAFGLIAWGAVSAIVADGQLRRRQRPRPPRRHSSPSSAMNPIDAMPTFSAACSPTSAPPENSASAATASTCRSSSSSAGGISTTPRRSTSPRTSSPACGRATSGRTRAPAIASSSTGRRPPSP
jgi:hypothetical protein